MGGRWGALWLSFWLVVLGTSSAFAQPRAADNAGKMSEARALFMAGRVAFDEGRYEAALKHFEASYEQSQRPALLYNIAQCYDRMRRDEEAIAAFERYLLVETDPEMRASVEARMGALRAAVAARKPAPASTNVALQADPIPAPHELVAASAPSLAVQPEPALQSAHSQPRWWLRAPTLVIAGGALVGLTGGLLMALGSAHGNDVEHAKVGSSYGRLHSDLGAAQHQWVAGQVLLGLGAATAAGGVAWLLLDRSDKPASVQVSLTPTSLRLGGRF